MKIIIAKGAFGAPYEPAWAKALQDLGHDCRIFDCHKLTLTGILGRVERRILLGPGIIKIRRELLHAVQAERPDVTLLYQGHYFDFKTVQRLRKFTFVTGYHNDDPFGGHRHMLRYRMHFLKSLLAYQGYHVYRKINLDDFRHSCGTENIALLRSYFIPEVDFPRNLTTDDMRKFGCDVTFAGHMERDIRLECIKKTIKEGIDCRIYGHSRNWQQFFNENNLDKRCLQPAIYGNGYRNALCGAKIVSCFFSKWNRDQYTRRVFEITACRAFMLAERTEAMKELFTEAKEAEYFDSPEEFADKCKYYLKNERRRQQIAQAGYERALSSGYDIKSRMRQWINDISQWKKECSIC
jgi:hypothetical protein